MHSFNFIFISDLWQLYSELCLSMLAKGYNILILFTDSCNIFSPEQWWQRTLCHMNLRVNEDNSLGLPWVHHKTLTSVVSCASYELKLQSHHQAIRNVAVQKYFSILILMPASFSAWPDLCVAQLPISLQLLHESCFTSQCLLFLFLASVTLAQNK